MEEEKASGPGANKNIIGIILILAGVGAIIYNWAYKPLFTPKTDTTQQVVPKTTTGSTSSSGTTAAPKAAYSSNIQVAVRGFAFTPTELHVKPGTKITWTNFDNAGHTITSDTGAFTSKILSKGQSYEYVFNKLGTYPYHCVLHPEMKAYIIVD